MNYSINDSEYPSVTTILGILDKSSALMGWAVNCMGNYIIKEYKPEINLKDLIDTAKREYRNESEKALDIGTELHDVIEKYIKEGKDLKSSIRPEVENGYLAFLEWEQKNAVKWIASEVVICDEENGYAGTLDAIAEINGKVYVIDFKSSKAIYDEYAFQVCAYVQAYNLIAEKKATAAGILRLDKETGLPEWKDYSENRGGWEKFYDSKIGAFKTLCQFYYQMKDRRLKNNPIVEKLKTKKIA